MADQPYNGNFWTADSALANNESHDPVNHDGAYPLAAHPVVENKDPLATNDANARIFPRQVTTGKTRGDQDIGGGFTMNDPTTGRTVETITDGTTTIYDASTTPATPQILMGKLPDGTFGMKVAQSGIDVTTATDSQLIFNSNQDVFKIAAKINTQFTLTSGGSTSATILKVPHGQSHVPLVFSTVTITADSEGGQTGVFVMPYITLGTGGGTTNVFIILSFAKQRGVDQTNISYDVGINGPSLTIAGTITSYILQETAA